MHLELIQLIPHALCLFEWLKKIFNEGDFNMRKWCSNDRGLMERRKE